MKYRGSLAVFGILLVLGFFTGNSQAQSLDEANTGGSRELFVRLNESSQQRLSFDGDGNNILGDHTQHPVDYYMLTRLTPGKQYKVTVEKVDGSAGAGFTVHNRATGNHSLYTTNYEETFTAQAKVSGPFEIWLLGGPTTYIVSFATVVYKITLSPLDPLERNDFIGPVNNVLPDGSLIRLPTEKTVYYIEQGRKRGFPSPYHFESWFMGQWDRIILVSQAVLNHYPTGPIMPFKDGTLLKYSDRPSDKTIFIIDKELRRAFTRWEDFVALGYSLQNVKPVPASILDSVRLGDNIQVQGPWRRQGK